MSNQEKTCPETSEKDFWLKQARKGHLASPKNNPRHQKDAEEIEKRLEQKKVQKKEKKSLHQEICEAGAEATELLNQIERERFGDGSLFIPKLTDNDAAKIIDKRAKEKDDQL